MNHHTISCRLGDDDELPDGLLRSGTILSDIDFIDPIGQLKFGLTPVLTQLDQMGLTPTEIATDLVILATALTAADTRISRDAYSQDKWTREIDVFVPVSDVGVWERQQDLLGRMLRFLTGDHWRIFFRARPPLHTALTRPSAHLRTVSATSVCLFSGGLDSFIGAVDLLCGGEQPLFVSHRWDTLTSSRQADCIDRLSARFPGHVTGNHLSARVGFDHSTVTASTIEDTLRGRSFLFFALATLAASAIGADVTVHVPENGLISLNVPLDPLRLGALSTRTTHPYYMARFNELLQGLGIGARLYNPYRHLTKGQMVERCLDREFLREHAAQTMSCSGPAKYRYHRDESMRKIQHCGHCVPCLIRRASLLHGFGEGGDETPYTVADLTARVLDSTKAEGEHVRAFQLALARLSADPGRARRDIHVPGPLLDHPDDFGAYEAVYVDGMQEVGRLLEGVRARALS
jgi:7-cyano-7-deazaguanine synthase in queuosine biosynthesis